MERRKPRIVVLGGGLGALSTVYWLTEAMPHWQERYESITVHQMGWRLGGKGASGRNASSCQRIEEHGFHVWFGFYENAFRMMRGLYEALARTPSPYRTFGSCEEAFTRRSVWTFEQNVPGAPRHWPVLFPVNDGVPGNGPDDFLTALRQNVMGWLANGRAIFFHRPDASWPLALVAGALRGVGLGTAIVGAAVGRVFEDVAALAAQVPHHPQRLRFVPHLLRTVIDAIWEELSVEADDEEAERVRFMTDLVGTIAVGVLQDDLWEPLWVPGASTLRAVMRRLRREDARSRPRSFEKADDEELRTWLLRHGAHPETVRSPLLKQVYDIAFAFSDGNREQPNLAAGTTARAFLRLLFGYKSAFMHEMQAGMGDTVFTPLYAVLKQRGVRFDFFHRVEALHLDANGARVEAIDFDRQLDVPDGAYEPFVGVKNLDCWPSEPLWDQLDAAQVAAFRQHLGTGGHVADLESSVTPWRGRRDRVEIARDDVVVLGLPIGVLPHTCGELLDRNERWRDMVANVPSIPTYAVQLWLGQTTEALGWKAGARDAWKWLDAKERRARLANRPSYGLEAVLCGYDDDLNAWADMSHLVARENWPREQEPKSIAYFCGTFDDGLESSSATPPPGNHYDTQLARVRASIQQVFMRRIGELWTTQPLGLDPAVLIAPSRNGDAGTRYDAQYWRVNVDPSERYTLTPSEGTKYRLGAGESGFANLVLAGDWIHNGVISMGCVEGTVVSGMEAAEAISRKSLGILAWRAPLPTSARWAPGVLERARLRGDPEADALVADMNGAKARQELWTQLRERRFKHADGLSTAPVIDPSSVELVQLLFNNHGTEIFLVLACYALPSAYAAGKGARVLGRSRYLLDEPVRRLCETARFVMDVMTDPVGRGLAAARHVRVIHATLRGLMLKSESEKWPEDEFGTPINQEDLLGTLMTFSWVVLDGLARLGVSQATDPRTREAVIEVWRAIGLELGIDPDLLPTSFEEAEALTLLIRARQIVPRNPNPMGRELTQRLVRAMEHELREWWFLPTFISCLMRSLLPPDVADALGVPRRLGLDEITGIAVRGGIPPGWVGAVLRRWSLALIDDVMEANDHDRQLVDLPWRLVADWWRPTT